MSRHAHKNTESSSDASNNSSSVVVGKTSKQKRQLGLPSILSGHVGIVVIVLIICAVVVGGILYLRHRASETASGNGAYTMSNEDFAKQQVEKYQKQTVTDSQSIAEKRSHYDELISYQIDAGDYKGAVESYQAFKKIMHGQPLNLNACLGAAKAYDKLGDKTSALAALDEAKRTTVNVSDKDLQASFLQAIENTRKDIEQ